MDEKKKDKVTNRPEQGLEDRAEAVEISHVVSSLP